MLLTSGFDIGIVHGPLKMPGLGRRVYADYYNWRGRSSVRVGYRSLDRREAVRGMKFGAELHITPHLTLNAGYQTNSLHLNGPYATLTYTIGASKFAWFGGNIVTMLLQPLVPRCLIKYIAATWLSMISSWKIMIMVSLMSVYRFIS